MILPADGNDSCWRTFLVCAPVQPEGPTFTQESWTGLASPFQETMDQVQQDLQHERAQNSRLADRVAAMEAAQVQPLQPQEDLRAQGEAFKVDTKHVREDLRRQLEAKEVQNLARCLMIIGLPEQHANDHRASRAACKS